MTKRSVFQRRTVAAGGIGVALALILLPATAASADVIIDGPVNLGNADSYGVLGWSTVTNTGVTNISGDVGVYSGSSLTGFPPGVIVNGTQHVTDAHAQQAQSDATTAYNVAAGLTPTATGLNDLEGLSLTPGVYSGGAMLLPNGGELTLAGSASSVWVFQASSTLNIGSGSKINITGGATSCNVFWQVGTSATLGTSAEFQGTILANQSITATTNATVAGRLLALNAAVTLDTNTITVPVGCPTPGTSGESASPVITAGTTSPGVVGTPYEHTVGATGFPTPTFTITSGELPPGLSLDSATGVISGTPTGAGDSTFTVTASNGYNPNSSETFVISVTTAVTPASTVTPTGGSGATVNAGSAALLLAPTGSNVSSPLGFAMIGIAAGLGLLALQRVRSNRVRADG